MRVGFCAWASWALFSSWASCQVLTDVQRYDGLGLDMSVTISSLDVETQALVEASLPAGATFKEVSRNQRNPKSYRLSIRAQVPVRSDTADTVLAVVWHSPSLPGNLKRGRNLGAERSFSQSLAPEGWSDLGEARHAEMKGAAKRSRTNMEPETPAAYPRRQPFTPISVNQNSDPCSASGASSHGGVRLGAGRPDGSVGKAERSKLMHQLQVYERLDQSTLASMTLAQLQKCKTYCEEKQLNKGYKRGQNLAAARSAARRRTEAQEREFLRLQDGHMFREQSIDYFADLIDEVLLVTSEEKELGSLHTRGDDGDQESALSRAQENKVLMQAQTLTLYYVQLRNLGDHPSPAEKDQALELAACAFPVQASTVARWEVDFRREGKLHLTTQGRWQQDFLLDEQDLRQQCTDWIKSKSNPKGQANMTVHDFRTYLNDVIMAQVAASSSGDHDPFKGLRITAIRDADGKIARHEVCLRTAHVWLRKLGFTYDGSKKSVYYDGHDREDVLEYRKGYLHKYHDLRECAEVWYKVSKAEAIKLDFNLEAIIDKRLKEGAADPALGDEELWLCVEDFEAPLIEHPAWLRARLQCKRRLPNGKLALFVYQDECIYKAYDSERKAWILPGGAQIKVKGDGTGLMVAGSIAHNIGFVSVTAKQVEAAQRLRKRRIKANTNPNVREQYRPIDTLAEDEAGNFWTYHTFEYGKNREGYWTGEKMIEHMTDVLDVLAVKFPGHSPVAFYDWSSCHDCLEPGAPSVSKMNVGVGGTRNGEEMPPMDSITLLEDTPLMRKGQVQQLTFQKGDAPPIHWPDATAGEYVGMVKGLKQTLAERGLYVPGMTKDGGKRKLLHLSMQYVLGQQPDFQAVPSSLQFLTERLGGECLMLPKYHCELNPIELVWGRSKFLVRRVCDYTYGGLKENVPRSFLPSTDPAVPGMDVGLIQKYCRKTHVYHNIFTDTDIKGLAALAKYKVYKSHRRPAPSEYNL